MECTQSTATATKHSAHNDNNTVASVNKMRVRPQFRSFSAPSKLLHLFLLKSGA